MTAWLDASIVLAAGMLAVVCACVRSDLAAAIAALNVASVVAIMALLTMTIAFGRGPFVDVPLALAPASLTGSFAFVRYLERHR